MTTSPPVGPEIDVQRAAELAIEDGYVLLDVREDEEWAAGRSALARHHRLGLILPEESGDPTTLPGVEPGTVVLALCRSGRRSQRAAAALTSAGWTVTNVTGGMLAWAEAGLPLEDADGNPGAVG